MRISIEKNLMVPMRDGVLLATDVYRPDELGPFPTLLTRLPYNKDGQPLTGYFDVIRAVQAGYVVVAQDTRGRWASDGEFNPFFDERDYATAMRTAFINAGLPATIGMLIDTSRNGWGGSGRPAGASTSTDLDTFVNASRIDRRLHRGNWCNQPGGIGARPQADPAPGFDAFVWIKPPGESDGTSDSTQTSPDAEGKRFDAMCDPNAQSRYDPSVKTGALPGAPAAGHWFESAFETLVQNAFPAL